MAQQLLSLDYPVLTVIKHTNVNRMKDLYQLIKDLFDIIEKKNEAMVL